MQAMDTQVVYIEFAFLENALLDGILLRLALRYSGHRSSYRLYAAACFGGALALLYPLLVLPAFWQVVYKVATGILLPVFATKKEKKSRLFYCVLLFFAFSFIVAGGVFALVGFLPAKEGYWLQKLPWSVLLALLLSAVLFAVKMANRVKRRKEQTDFFVDCVFQKGDRQWQAKGFVDTGNRARHFGVPVCFVTPAIFGEMGEEKLSFMRVKTVTGEKEIPLVKMKKLRINQGGQTHIINGVYLSPNLALCDREYDVLLGAWACV